MQVNLIDNFNLNFQAMKPNQFRGIDYAVVRKFKAPVEKFNSNTDFQNWAFNLFKELSSKVYKSKMIHADVERKIVINKWKNFLLEKTYFSHAKLLLVFSAMVKNLKENNDEIPPVIQENILYKSLNEVENKLENDKDLQFDFNGIYKKELKDYYMKDFPKDYTGWLILPSKRKNKEDFENNVERLKLISNSTWCTKKWYYAESYLGSGDFHCYLENGVPKLGIRFSGCEIQEVQGEKNNSAIPKEYLDIVKKYIIKGNYYLNEDARYLIDLSERANL